MTDSLKWRAKSWSRLFLVQLLCDPTSSISWSTATPQPPGRTQMSMAVAWFCYSVHRLLVIWFVGMLWWRKTDDWRRTSSVPGQEPKLQVGHLQHNGHPAPSLPWTSWSLSAPFLFCTSQWFSQPAPSSPWQPESNLYQFFCDIKLAVIPHQLSEAFKLQLAKIRFYKYRQCRPTCIA